MIYGSAARAGDPPNIDISEHRTESAAPRRDIEPPDCPVRTARNWLFAVSAASGAAAAAIVVATDPGWWSERVFLVLCACCCSALSTAGMLYLFQGKAMGWVEMVRALRRGCLAGAACTSLLMLQFAAALTITNVAFVWLILAIVEMIFLAGHHQQHEFHEQG